MIHSYSKIKTDRNYNEDFKTYSTLGVLQYLPAQFFWTLIKESVVEGQSLTDDSGEIVEAHFWPKWYKIQNINVVSNSTYIEPDVFIRFENFDCIIEVKKTDSGGQHSDQWESQTQAYKNEYPEGREIYYIALGGNPSLDAARESKINHVYKSTWHKLLRAISKALEERVNLTYRTETDNQEIRILQSAVDAFARYNEYVVEFMDSMSISKSVSLPTQNTLNRLWKI